MLLLSLVTVAVALTTTPTAPSTAGVKHVLQTGAELRILEPVATLLPMPKPPR